MTVDWRATQAARDAAQKRAELESVDRAIAEVEGYLAEARDFEGYFSEQIGAVERQASAINTAYSGGMFPEIVRRPNEAGEAEVQRLRGVRDALIRERKERRKAATVTSEGQYGQTYSHCLLSVNDMTKRLGHLGAVRGRVAGELADLEAKCTPGELCQAGVPAPDFTDYTRKAEALRYGPGVVVRFGGAS